MTTLRAEAAAAEDELEKSPSEPSSACLFRTRGKEEVEVEAERVSFFPFLFRFFSRVFPLFSLSFFLYSPPFFFLTVLPALPEEHVGLHDQLRARKPGVVLEELHPVGVGLDLF